MTPSLPLPDGKTLNKIVNVPIKEGAFAILTFVLIGFLLYIYTTQFQQMNQALIEMKDAHMQQTGVLQSILRETEKQSEMMYTTVRRQTGYVPSSNP